jgi:hypothetical protein
LPASILSKINSPSLLVALPFEVLLKNTLADGMGYFVPALSILPDIVYWALAHNKPKNKIEVKNIFCIG